jgi:predicted nucleotidyltransferase
MGNISKVFLSKAVDEVVITILRAVIPVLERQSVDYFVVGAFARDLELLSMGHNEPPVRKTKDIDIAVMIGSIEEFDRLKAAVVALPDFEINVHEPYRLSFRKAYDLDFLPFGEIANEKGVIELEAKQTFLLDMPGFDAAYPFADTIKTEEGLTLKVSSLAGVVMLKLLAWQDRPERARDIQDIDYIFKHLYWLQMDEILSTDGDIPELYQYQDLVFMESVAARYIGRQMSIMLKDMPKLRSRVYDLLHEHTQGFRMARLMSSAHIESNQQIIQALYNGFQDRASSE